MESVLIFGANSDIAGAIAREFALNQYNLILAGRSLNKLTKLQKDISIKHDVIVDTVFFDALDSESHRIFLDNLDQVPKITVCAFGYLGDQEQAQRNFFETERILHTNFTGAVSILNEIANRYESEQHGIIVGIGSVAGDRGRQSNYIYGSAKAAFSAYLSGLRNRLFKSGCHVVEIKPGFVDTKMTEGLNLPKPLTAKPEDVASAVYKAVQDKSDVVYVLGIWRLIMFVIKNIPDFIFKRLKL